MKHCVFKAARPSSRLLGKSWVYDICSSFISFVSGEKDFKVLIFQVDLHLHEHVSKRCLHFSSRVKAPAGARKRMVLTNVLLGRKMTSALAMAPSPMGMCMPRAPEASGHARTLLLHRGAPGFCRALPDSCLAACSKAPLQTRKEHVTLVTLFILIIKRKVLTSLFYR